MTRRPASADREPPADDDLIAAEYVLGTLPHDARVAVAARLRDNPEFAERVAGWERRLAGLNDGYESTPAPDLMPAIEARLFGRGAAPVPLWRRFWPALVGGAATAVLAVAALLLLVDPVQLPGASPELTAELATEDDTLAFTAAWFAERGVFEITQTAGAPAETGRDYQLWIIEGEAAPEPAGLLREPVTRIDVTPRPGVTLAISLEPEGGSPTGQPTGPVLVTAPLTES